MIDWKWAAKRLYSKSLYWKYATRLWQTHWVVLSKENDRLRATLAYLESRIPDYPILEVLLKQAKERASE